MKADFIKKTIHGFVEQSIGCGSNGDGRCSAAEAEIACAIIGCADCDQCSRPDGFCVAVADFTARIASIID